jgi:hypothetical protein
MLFPTLLAISVLMAGRGCPVGAITALPEFTGAWQVLRISGLDRARPDSAMARTSFSSDLQGCLIREQLRAETGNPPYEALIYWGANGPDANIQRVFAHSQHGRFGFYEGPRTGSTISLRQLPLAAQPSTNVVENQVMFADADQFALVSRLSTDGGRTWTMLSRWEYRRLRS